jgi:hypothetical protein
MAATVSQRVGKDSSPVHASGNLRMLDLSSSRLRSCMTPNAKTHRTRPGPTFVDTQWPVPPAHLRSQPFTVSSFRLPFRLRPPPKRLPATCPSDVAASVSGRLRCLPRWKRCRPLDSSRCRAEALVTQPSACFAPARSCLSLRAECLLELRCDSWLSPEPHAAPSFSYHSIMVRRHRGHDQPPHWPRLSHPLSAPRLDR